MPHEVFISYSHKDKAIADAICARLEQDGVRCWYAPRDIRPGEDWAASIISAINSVKIMVLVFTDASNASRQVLREINNAVSAGVILLPFKLTDSPPCQGMQYYLSAVHWLDAVEGPVEKKIEELSGLIRTILQPEKAPEQEAGRAAVPAGEKRPRRTDRAGGRLTSSGKKGKIIGAAAALAVALGARSEEHTSELQSRE